MTGWTTIKKIRDFEEKVARLGFAIQQPTEYNQSYSGITSTFKSVCHRVEDFCREHFGPGGVQKGRRWFYRLLSPVTIEAYHDKTWNRTRHRRITPTNYTEDYTVVYFRDPADAVWFRLKFGADNGNV